MNAGRLFWISLCLIISSIAALSGCTGQLKQWEPTVKVVSPPPRTVWAIVTKPPKSQDESVFFYQYPEDRRIFAGPKSQVLSFWGNGYLFKGPNGAEWRELDPESGTFDVKPGLDITNWDTPIALDVKNEIVFAFGNSVPPSRKIQMHFFNGQAPFLVNELTADKFDTLWPLPANGWSVFYVDRPHQAGAVSPDTASTRRLRVYGAGTIGGELPNVQGVYLLDPSVAVHTDKDWILYEMRTPVEVGNRTMSLSQIPGDLRPLARIGDTILVASDQSASYLDKTVIESSLYTYGAYTREVARLWDGSERTKILSLTPVSEGDYLIVLSSSPDQKTLTLGELKGEQKADSWQTLATATLANEVTYTAVFTIAQPKPPVSETQGSTVGAESVIQGEGSTVHPEQPLSTR